MTQVAPKGTGIDNHHKYNKMNEIDVIKAGVKIATEVAKERTGEIYDDALKPASQEAGSALQAIVGLFNNVVLYPIKTANISFRYKLEMFERDLAEKLKDTPPAKLITPKLSIAGPTIEALKYTFDTKELREMYLTLLASAMNADKCDGTHPAFTEVIKAMSPLDSVIFRDAAKFRQIPCARITIGFETKIFTTAMPQNFIPDLIQNRDPFAVSRSVENLCRLGLLTHRDNTIIGYNYDAFLNHTYVEERRSLYAKTRPDVTVTAKVNGEVILLNDFGFSFKEACVD
jgi:hypothetical protein